MNTKLKVLSIAGPTIQNESGYNTRRYLLKGGLISLRDYYEFYPWINKSLDISIIAGNKDDSF